MFGVVKSVASWVIPIGTELICGSIAQRAVRDQNIWCKVAAGIASVAIGGMISDKAVDYVNDELDGIVEKWKKIEEKRKIRNLEEGR